MERNTAERLIKDLSSCNFFLYLCWWKYESARLAIFSQFCRHDEVCEEMVSLVTLPEHTTRAEICKAVMNELSTWQIHISKVVSARTDGAPSETGEKAEFVNLFAKAVSHSLIGFHCIINEGALCAKTGLQELQEVIQTVTKVVNYISARVLNKRQFQILLNKVESVYKELKMYNNVRWLSQGLILKWFVECLDETKLFFGGMIKRVLPRIVWYHVGL